MRSKPSTNARFPAMPFGEEVMRHLRRIDQVAYVRLASVYKEFRDDLDIMEEISNLGKPKIDQQRTTLRRLHFINALFAGSPDTISTAQQIRRPLPESD